MAGLHVGLVGLGFGAEFAPIYLDHPNVGRVTISDANPARLSHCAGRFPGVGTVSRFDDMVRDPSIDAIHLVTGIPDHARQAVAVLQAGKHCASTVPMATSLEDCRAVVAAERESGKRYMMMETAVYTRQYLYAQGLRDRGEFGRIQFLRGAHYQCMECWPRYWAGLPPMWYATHAVGPVLAIADTRAVRVRCLGSGAMRHELHRQYGNPYPIETALFELEEPGLSAEITRSLFHCARPYMESFTVYGEDGCYEWQDEQEDPMLFRADPVTPGRIRAYSSERPEPPDRADLLPEPIQKYTRRFVYGEDQQHLSFEQGGGHHGSHPHLVHEFVSAIVEDRPARVDAVTAAQWSAAGICAHQSAMQGGEAVIIPAFS